MHKVIPNNAYSSFDYYPFGMIMPGRSYTANSSYRFGFDGQERDDEISGAGNINTAEYWEYDARLGRRWNVDPKLKVGISGYVAFLNNPIFNSDVLGDTTSPVILTPHGKSASPYDNGTYSDDVGAAKKENNNAVNVYTHSTQNNIQIPTKGGHKWSHDTKEIADAIDKNLPKKVAEDWKSGKTALVLHSCRSGRNKKDGSPGIAQEISKAYPQAVVIAPDERIVSSNGNELGPFKLKYGDKNGDYTKKLPDGTFDKTTSDEMGNWNVFRAGEKTATYSGQWHPKDTNDFITNAVDAIFKK